ncbi:PAS protein [Labilithrix luteola]|uniref:PAS protein n=1 Tax=Labilithrix luteola TaxID=1391654 RepID=A0A0K1PUS4_9BACT|nr:STAS domain-containing protein [Labilithrix luteola]AKU96884.1 PAS protein [Labilithrix luteola]
MENEELASVDAMLSVLEDVARGNLRKRVPIPGDAQPRLSTLAHGVNRVIEAWRASEIESRKMRKTLEAKVAQIETQTVALRELSTPVLEVTRDVLLLPVIGALHTRRTADMMNTLLEKIMSTQATQVIVDVSGVEVVDTTTADTLLRIVRAAKLLGARCVLTGVSPMVAQTLVDLGTDLSELRTLRRLADGLVDCMIEAQKNNDANLDIDLGDDDDTQPGTLATV